MVTHTRLQHYKANYCSLLMTGILGCRWHRYKQSKRSNSKSNLFWFCVLVLSFLYVTFCFYFWLVAKGNHDSFNWYLYTQLYYWYPWYNVLLACTCTVFAYYLLLMVLSLCHVIHGHQLYIFPVHLVAMVLTLSCCIAFTVIVEELWLSEWRIIQISLQMFGPFLHLGSLIVMTALSWVIAGQWLQIHRLVWRLLSMVLFLFVMLTLYFSPLFMHSPCVIEYDQLPDRPKLIGHRGMSGYSPEGTVISYKYAIKHGAWGLEADVRISYDGIPFLHHDNNLIRTTNVIDILPERANYHVTTFTWDELQELNAGKWFLEDDPMGVVSSLTQEEEKVYARQKLMKLSTFVQLAQESGMRVIFDLFSSPKYHPFHNDTVELILDVLKKEKIQLDKVLWTYGDAIMPNWTEGFRFVSNKYISLESIKAQNISFINVECSQITNEQIREYSEAKVPLNLYTVNSAWLMSWCWCLGVYSISTDYVGVLNDVNAPVWTMPPKDFLIMWVTVDVLSVIIIVIIFLVQKRRYHRGRYNPEIISIHMTTTALNLAASFRTRSLKAKLLKEPVGFEIELSEGGGTVNNQHFQSDCSVSTASVKDFILTDRTSGVTITDSDGVTLNGGMTVNGGSTITVVYDEESPSFINNRTDYWVMNRHDEAGSDSNKENNSVIINDYLDDKIHYTEDKHDGVSDLSHTEEFTIPVENVSVISCDGDIYSNIIINSSSALCDHDNVRSVKEAEQRTVLPDVTAITDNVNGTKYDEQNTDCY